MPKTEKGAQEEDVLVEKPKRVKRSLTERDGLLVCKPLDGYHLRWVSINDPHQPMNYDWAIRGGYEPVTNKEQGLVNRSGDPAFDGADVRRTGKDGITLLLMKQPQEFYEEELADFKAHNDGLVEEKLKQFNTLRPTFTIT